MLAILEFGNINCSNVLGIELIVLLNEAYTTTTTTTTTITTTTTTTNHNYLIAEVSSNGNILTVYNVL